MAYNQFIKMMIIFSIAFIAVLILKVSGPCPTALGGAVRLCGPKPSHARLLGGEEVCLPLLPFRLLAPYPSPSHSSSPNPLGILGGHFIWRKWIRKDHLPSGVMDLMCNPERT